MTATPINATGTVSIVVAAIDTIAAAGITPATATVIQRSAQTTIVLVTYPGGNNVALKLPIDSVLGDILEVHAVDPSQGFGLYPNDGESINGIVSTDANPNDLGIPVKSVTVLRKVASTNWSVLSQSTFGP